MGWWLGRHPQGSGGTWQHPPRRGRQRSRGASWARNSAVHHTPPRNSPAVPHAHAPTRPAPTPAWHPPHPKPPGGRHCEHTRQRHTPFRTPIWGRGRRGGSPPQPGGSAAGARVQNGHQRVVLGAGARGFDGRGPASSSGAVPAVGLGPQCRRPAGCSYMQAHAHAQASTGGGGEPCAARHVGEVRSGSGRGSTGGTGRGAGAGLGQKAPPGIRQGGAKARVPPGKQPRRASAGIRRGGRCRARGGGCRAQAAALKRSARACVGSGGWAGLVGPHEA